MLGEFGAGALLSRFDFIYTFGSDDVIAVYSLCHSITVIQQYFCILFSPSSFLQPHPLRFHLQLFYVLLFLFISDSCLFFSHSAITLISYFSVTRILLSLSICVLYSFSVSLLPFSLFIFRITFIYLYINYSSSFCPKH